MGTNTAYLDDDKELHKNKSKNKEKVENSGEEDEDGSLDELNSKNKSNDNDKQQESYFKTGSEKATNMEANTVPPSVGVSGLRNHVERFHANGAVESKHEEELENVEKQKTWIKTWRI